MKSYRKELWFEAPSRRAFINITPQVMECLRESGIMEGLILVKTKHLIHENVIPFKLLIKHRNYLEKFIQQKAV